MLRFTQLLAVWTAAFCFSIAMAAVEATVETLPSSGEVMVSGTVEKVNSERVFTLRDNSGSIPVKLTSGESVVLKEGDSVTVIGRVENLLWGLMGKDIAAHEVQVHKELPHALSDVLTRTTGLTVENAKKSTIDNLPAEGAAEITGTVGSVDNERQFQLTDHSGSIDVLVESGEKVAVAKGAQVIVIGYVDKNLLGSKRFHATRVVVLADAPTS